MKSLGVFHAWGIIAEAQDDWTVLETWGKN